MYIAVSVGKELALYELWITLLLELGLRVPRLLGGCMWRMQFALPLYWFGRRCGRAFFHDVITFVGDEMSRLGYEI